MSTYVQPQRMGINKTIRDSAWWNLTINEKIVMWDISSWAHVCTAIITKMECTGLHAQPAMHILKHAYSKVTKFRNLAIGLTIVDI